jgi:hypothetical protein
MDNEVAARHCHIAILGTVRNRQRIFGSDEDYAQMLRPLEEQKARLPFYLYA